ncbi:glycosyltransferase [Reinekea marinisedimentorum]|uniref:Glycosyltransferase involved in cell wall biosynthesis n=1 Tax=Reinekea marinisedimentorum TaxID=230495 RepID=A0A4R3I812_9GAMM|nr:glycosyltransferase [Reinekea marinisedimentorum]TCS42383.1 glycosyltransferase involved in cell wall biosynthesis [Reinekea marinisedimentorum]
MGKQSTTAVTHVQIVQHLQPGGIETMVLDLARFAEQGKKALIVSLEGTETEALARWPRLKEFRDQLAFLNKQPGWQLKTFWELHRLLRRNNVERVHTHHIGPMLYGGVAARLAGVQQWVHTEHDAWHLQNPRHRKLAGFCFRSFKPCLVADAGMVADQIKTQLPGVSTEVIYNGIDTQRFCPGNQQQAREHLGLPVDKQLIGCAARLHEVKGQHRLIHLIKKFPAHVHLALAGSGDTKQQLVELAYSLKVADRVHFLGAIDDMPEFYRSLDVFCLTSDFEGLPLSPLEAQACNIPAVVTDVGGARETVCPKTGYWVPLDNEAKLITAVANAFMRPQYPQPRTFIEQQYDVRKMVKEYSAVAKMASQSNWRTAS